MTNFVLKAFKDFMRAISIESRLYKYEKEKGVKLTNRQKRILHQKISKLIDKCDQLANMVK